MQKTALMLLLASSLSVSATIKYYSKEPEPLLQDSIRAFFKSPINQEFESIEPETHVESEIRINLTKCGKIVACNQVGSSCHTVVKKPNGTFETLATRFLEQAPLHGLVNCLICETLKYHIKLYEHENMNSNPSD